VENCICSSLVRSEHGSRVQPDKLEPHRVGDKP
jgi:hypothetical protein